MAETNLEVNTQVEKLKKRIPLSVTGLEDQQLYEDGGCRH